MIIENVTDLESYYFDCIIGIFHHLIKEEFKQDFDQIDAEVRLRFVPDSVALYELSFANCDKTLTKDKIREEFDMFLKKERSDIMVTETRFTTVDPIKFKSFTLDVRTDTVRRIILRSLPHLELLERFLENIARHEIGHILDYWRFNGATFKEAQKYLKANDEEEEKWFETEFKDSIDRLRAYQNLPMESMANKLGIASAQEMIAFQELIRQPKKNEQYEPKRYTFEINCHESEKGS